MDKIVTGMTVDDIKKTKISAHQEKLVKAVTAENIAKYDKVKNSLDNRQYKQLNGMTGGGNVNSVNSEAVHSATSISDRIVFAWNLAKRNSIAAF